MERKDKIIKACWEDNFNEGKPDKFHVPVTDFGPLCEYFGLISKDF